MKTNGTSKVSRRGFIGAIGAATAAVALPVSVSAATWPTVQAQIPALRAAYMAEVERLAEALRPRFESGELRANTSADFDRYDEPGVICTHGDLENMPMGRCEAAAAAEFGLAVTVTDDEDGGRTYEGDEEAAYVVLACSPHAEITDNNYNHPAHHAQTAAALDVIAVARARGMYVPTADEEFQDEGEVRS